MRDLLAKFRPKLEGFEVSQNGTFTYIFRVMINVRDFEELSDLVRSFDGIIKFMVE